MLENRQVLIDICEELAQQEDLKVTFRSAAKDATFVTLGALLGGLLMGPIGIAVGGTLMAITRAVMNRGKYKSVVHILKHDLTSNQQSKLATGVQKAIRDLTSVDFTNVVPLVLNIAILKEAVLREINLFMSSEMNLNMVPVSNSRANFNIT